MTQIDANYNYPEMPSTLESETKIGELAADAIAYLVRTHNEDVIDILGLGAYVQSDRVPVPRSKSA